jgi:hypothetical protein
LFNIGGNIEFGGQLYGSGYDLQNFVIFRVIHPDGFSGFQPFENIAVERSFAKTKTTTTTSLLKEHKISVLNRYWCSGILV